MSKIETPIIDAILRAIKNTFPNCSSDTLSNLYLEIPRQRKFGDFSTNIAMRLAGSAKKPPNDIAAALAENIKKNMDSCKLGDLVEDVKVEKPGFINFYLSSEAVISSLREILMNARRFGRVSIGKGKKVQIEFVSANPTGPLTVAHGRQAAVGDSLARILESCAYKVTREYYVNDEGVQINLLGESVKARLKEVLGRHSEFPENGYKGDYIYEIARKILRSSPKIKHSIEDTDAGVFSDYAYKHMMRAIKKDLKDFGVIFDVWFSQRRLSKKDLIKKALMILKEKSLLYEKDGATWFASTRFGDDKDRVVVKNDGSYTYLAPDIAYHKIKLEKGYHKIINIWGPDHHGYVNRIKSACQALGHDKDRVSILISQLVSLYRNKQPVRMSTREGDFVTLRQIIDEVGKDAGRFFFMMRRTDSHLDFDLELAKAKTMDNPVYYIQYAYARISSIIRFAGRRVRASGVALDLLDKKEELDVIKKLMQYPKIIESSAKNLEPFILLSYLQDLAVLFHSYYDSHRVVTDDRSLTKARIALISALQQVFRSGLTLLGVSAPTKM